MTKAIKSSKFKDSNGNLSKTYVITKPGIYHLCQSIEFVPITQGQSAIQILSDDVVLDLRGHILQQVGGDLLNAIGVRVGVEDGLQVFKNITVKNGTIKFSGQGIAAFNAVEQPLVFDNLTFSDLNLSECGSESTVSAASGINLSSSITVGLVEKVTTFAYTNVCIENCKVNNCQGNGAIAVSTCDGLLIQNTEANGTSADFLTIDSRRLAGVQVYGNNLQLTNVQINNTHFRALSFDNGFIYNVAGLLSSSSTNVTFKNCSANNTTSEQSGSSFLIVGLYLLYSDNIIINSCQFNGTTSFGDAEWTTGNFAAACSNVAMTVTTFNNTVSSRAFALTQQYALEQEFWTTLSTNHYYLNCQFNNTYGRVFGEAISSGAIQNVIYENCQFNNTTCGPDGVGVETFHISDYTGQIEPSSGIKWINCQFNGTTSLSTDPFSFVNVFYIITAQNLMFQNCQLTNTTNTGFATAGFVIGTVLDDVNFSTENVTFQNCVISDMQGPDEVIAIQLYTPPKAFDSIAGIQRNMIIKNCIVENIHSTSNNERVAGIAFASSNDIIGVGPDQLVQRVNISITDCRISDVKAGEGNPLSAGILLESVENPVLSKNSVSDCDRGILFTGTNQVIPNGFQVADSYDNAVAIPPIPINLEVPGNVEVLFAFGDYVAGPNIYGDLIQANKYQTSLYSGQSIQSVEFGLFHIPSLPGSDVYNLTFQLYDSIFVGDDDVPNNVKAFTTILVSDISFNNNAAIFSLTELNYAINSIGTDYFFIAVDYSGAYPPSGQYPDQFYVGSFLTVPNLITDGNNRAYVKVSDGTWFPQTFWNGINGDLWINPTINGVAVDNAQVPSEPYEYVDITTQTFTNDNATVATVGGLNSTSNFILAAEDLATLKWQTGDAITYNCNGSSAIPDLVCEDPPKTYYAIVYRPGFTRRGLVQENKVTNCTVSGYQDDYVDSQDPSDAATRSAWINNVALLNGDNYSITWASGTPQVDEGTLGEYPTVEHKYWNLSITQ